MTTGAFGQPKAPTPDEVRAEILSKSEYIDTIVEAMVGYRAKFEAAGFSPTVSEQMAQAIVLKALAG